jgi:hypothetical protein
VAREVEAVEKAEVARALTPPKHHAKDRQVEDRLRESLRALPHCHAASEHDDDPPCQGMDGKQGIACTSKVEAAF